MKRLVALLLILMLILSLAACGKKPTDTTSTTTTAAPTTTTTASTAASTDGSTASSTAPSAGVTSSTAASNTDSTTTAMPVATQTAVGKTTTAAQTGTTVAVTSIEGTVWNLTYLDNYNVLHRYTLNFKEKKLQYDSGVIWSEAFTPENWAHQKIKHPHSAATFDGAEYYMDVTVTYNITCKVADKEASLTYRLGNGTTISQKFALENDNTLRVVSDDNPYGSLAEHRYRP